MQRLLGDLQEVGEIQDLPDTRPLAGICHTLSVPKTGCQMPGTSRQKIITRANAYIIPPACQAPPDAECVSTLTPPCPSSALRNAVLGWNDHGGAVQRGGKIAGGREAEALQGSLVSQEIRDSGPRDPGFQQGEATVSKQVTLGRHGHSWVEGKQKPPTPRKGNGNVGTLPPPSSTWPSFSPPAGQGHTNTSSPTHPGSS